MDSTGVKAELEKAQASETNGLPPVVGKSELKHGFGDEVGPHRHTLAAHGSAEPGIPALDISRWYQTGNAA